MLPSRNELLIPKRKNMGKKAARGGLEPSVLTHPPSSSPPSLMSIDGQSLFRIQYKLYTGAKNKRWRGKGYMLDKADNHVTAE